MSLQSTTLRKIVVVCVFAVIVEPIFASLPSRGGASWGPGKSDTKSHDYIRLISILLLKKLFLLSQM